MKIFLIDGLSSHKGQKDLISWRFIADSALTNAGKPFFIPEGHGPVAVAVAPVIRISRLGKTIAPKFAKRYYSEVAPALHFSLPEYKELLRKSGLSTDPAISFDRSLIAGDFCVWKENEALSDFVLSRNGEKVAEWRLADLEVTIDEIIHRVSKMNTLKMGDLIFPLQLPVVTIEQGDYLEVASSMTQLLTVKVK